KLEIGRRRAKERVAHLEAQLRKLSRRREQRRHKRTREGVPTVAIVGYTNAGKSTLLNTLTGASVLAEDKLFATLDTRSRHLAVGWAGYGDREIVITDTVGFIRDLPEDLFAAFRATFEEAADADLILHVVDAGGDGAPGADGEGGAGARASVDAYIETTLGVLEELGLDEIPRVLVFNKVELLAPLDRKILQRRYPDAILVSALDRESTRPLLARLASELAERWDRSARVPVAVAAVEDAPSGEEGAPSDEHDAPPSGDTHASTLDELLRAAGRRARGRSGVSRHRA
ncbi:MAG: 50S ribosome-binding GTPase, partial [Labilithrix sp.]|nr:50S ribosome-binding GTPase [Labilithrix sp.]